jgi:hypothetical protein
MYLGRAFGTNVYRGKRFEKRGGDLDQLNECELLNKDPTVGDN